MTSDRPKNSTVIKSTINKMRTITTQLPSGMEKNLIVGSGVIVGNLGTGGMSKVYKIWNQKLEVSRAVKILYPNKKFDLHERFATESKISAQLRHPNIIEVHDCGEWRGLPYIEMELLDGISLRNILKKYGRLPAIVAVAIGIQILKALKYAHNHKYTLYNKEYTGVIHRDLKPENIIILKQGFLKLMDFGVARPIKVGLHTKHGFIVGTLQYLPPELFDGEEIDYSADIYSFGAIMYELLIGKMAFPQNGFENLIKVKMTGSYRKIKEFHYVINPTLVRMTEKCLHTNKSKRYTSSIELLDTMTEILKSMSNKSPEKILEDFISDPVAYVINQNTNILEIFIVNVSRLYDTLTKKAKIVHNFIKLSLAGILYKKRNLLLLKEFFRFQYLIFGFLILVISLSLLFLMDKSLKNDTTKQKRITRQKQITTPQQEQISSIQQVQVVMPQKEQKSEWNRANWDELEFE